MKPLRSPSVEFVDLTGDSNEEAGNLSNTSCEAPAAYDGNQDAKAPSINKTTANATILRPFVSPLHEMESVSQEPEVGSPSSTELASPVQEHVIWEKPIRGRLEHVNTGGCVNSLRLVILPLEDGHDSLWRASDKSPAIAALGVGTNSIPDCPIQPGESCSNCNTPTPPGTISPSSLPLSTDPAVGSTRVSVGRVVLPQGDYSSPSGCRATRLSLRVARRALEVRASEVDRFGGCEFPLQRNQDGSRFVGDIDVPEDCDYDSAEDCRLVACWLGLAKSMMKEREDTLCRGDSVPPVGNTDGIDLGVEEQVFGEPKPQNTGSAGKKRRTQRTLRSRKRLQWSD
ncbi:hypothetical protein ACJ73_07996 [Blastomyces percursus]|uniref:Uncharacterized protein n=1 Tax=Blastomyces percursus TaxID=1658174 RepID=A0A1J9PXM9_9EURO|nr:hypothetical protein ACJ73_07996 [Blastomyces percursus]